MKKATFRFVITLVLLMIPFGSANASVQALDSNPYAAVAPTDQAPWWNSLVSLLGSLFGG